MGITSAYLTETPESPVISGDRDGKQTTRIYSINNSLVPEIESMMPQTGFYDSTDGWFMGFQLSSGVAYSKIQCKYVSDIDAPGSSMTAFDGQIKYNLSVNRIEKQIEECRNMAGEKIYRTIWNYNIYQSFEIVDADKRNDITKYPVFIPSWVDTATDFSEADGIKYVWAKQTPPDFKQKSVEFFWKRAQGMSKPGVEAFVVAQAVISERKHCKRKKDAISFLRTRVERAKPKETFGWPSDGDTHWLSFPNGITEDGKYWIAENVYEYADKWDVDLYPYTGAMRT